MSDLNQVDKFYEIIDSACMLIYEETGVDYLNAFIRVGNDLLNGVDDAKLTKEKITELESIYAKLDDFSFSNESIRMALNLLLAKGIKHNGNYKLDLITPDSVSLLVGDIISHYFLEGVCLFETNLGLGSQINAISNFLDIDVVCLGQEKDYLLAKLAKIVSNLQDNDITIFNNSAVDPLDVSFDCLIGHLESEKDGDKYLPYEIINNYMKNLSEDGIFVLTISNDFFSYGVDSFKQKFCGTLLGLIVLPESMFKTGNQRCILVGSKTELDDYELFVSDLPSLNSGEKFVKSLANIEKWIDETRERVKRKLDI